MPITLAHSIFAVAFLFSPIECDYSFVVGETAILASANTLFTNLLSSATLSSPAAPVYPTCLNRTQYPAYLAQYSPKWNVSYGITSATDTLNRQWVAADFRAAFAVMSATAVLADVNNHHPLWTNVYNSLNVALSTDDKGCLSDYDFFLARGMEIVWGNYSCGSAKCGNKGLCDPGLSEPVCTCAPRYSGASCNFIGPGIPGISVPPGWLDQPNAPALLAVSILLGLQSLYVGWTLVRSYMVSKGPTGTQPIYAAVGEGYGT
jgi:4a-hydroxytetrahydrobiopterin dehydratase